MKPNVSTVVVVGGGIAGLCAAVYARKCGYRVELLEQNDTAGGLATSWRRGDYTFETCLHWLLGSKSNGALHTCWREIFDIDRLKFIYPKEFVRIEDERGGRLSVYSDADLLETELLRRAPEDAAAIRRFLSDLHRLAHFEMPDPNSSSLRNLRALLGDLPCLPAVRRLSRIDGEEYGRRFNDPLVRRLFAGGEMSRMSVIVLFFALIWQNQRNAGYPVGGSQAVTRPIVENLQRLGAKLHLRAKARRIVVDGNTAAGVQLADGEIIRADWVISAADRHSTVNELLDGMFSDRACEAMKPFPSYLQVSLGIARDLSAHPGFLVRLLDAPLHVDPRTDLSNVAFRFFHFDPTFAPKGKTAVTCFLPTYNYEYWTQLQQNDSNRYQAEKRRVAEQVSAILEHIAPEVNGAIETVDVSTPATIIRYTGNWNGSMEGWLLTPGSGFRALPNRLPGLRRFLMAGHWVMPGGGLPSGLITARQAICTICKEDGIEFAPSLEGTAQAAA
jgi:phytoene dehydrogenase-like protein